VLAACCLAGAMVGTSGVPSQVHLGDSSQGRPIDGYLLGSGPATAVIVGGIHGRPELNASELVWQMLEYFEDDPAAIPHGLELLFVPEANPDGLAAGTRELADGVDPNRNFPTHDWSPATYGPGKWLADGGGDGPLSEPETVALANLVERLHPVAVLSYHSAAGVAMGGPAAESAGMLAAYADHSGYPARQFVAYPVTGDFAQWCDDLGIPTVEVELSDHADAELERNLAGMQAALEEIVARYPSYLGLK
jgi:murein peptide amidase A